MKRDAPPMLKCAVCGGMANVIATEQPCFHAPKTFDVAECPGCETRFVSPMEAGSEVYDLIYSNAAKVPGYARYERYAAALVWNPDPLAYLAGEEDVYWSIKQSVERIAAERARPLRILEIGSGFGYLTYALRKSGHDCTGLDISERAVAGATEKFGPFYKVADLMQFKDDGDGFDVVVATELIEHVVDPSALLVRAREMLRPGGSIIITTPNKDLYSDRRAWHTDLAPVHLWWFSKTSMRRLGWALGLEVKFVDFSEFYGASEKPVRGMTKPQTFDAEGRVVYRDSPVNTLARALMAMEPGLFKTLGRIFLKRMAKEKLADTLYRESLSLCAVMTTQA